MADDEKELAIVIKSFTEFSERLMKKLTLDITAHLIQDTPVDTGWARANWVPSITNPPEWSAEGVSRVAWGTEGNQAERAAEVPKALAAQGEGLASIPSYVLANGPTYISNNVHYILKLNDGYSGQAPSGYVQIAIAKGIQDNAQVAP